MEGSLTIVVYDLESVSTFIYDMKLFKIFERTIADAVFGVNTSMVRILAVTPIKGPIGRRLEFLSSDMPPKQLTPRRPPPAPRWLQAGAGRPEDVYEAVKQPTALEAAGVKPDGKSGGPKEDSMKVYFRIMTGDDGQTAHRALLELNTINTETFTFQMEALMESLSLPQMYIVSVVGIDAYPAIWTPVVNDTNVSNASKASVYSSATSLFRPTPLLSVAWRSVAIVAAIAANVMP